ncbi:MAG: rhomboid family intramembrane serine protease [Deltaproteobacteria bacterium]|nr:rhomboid family intramembrane serine protease [Deltaproteobacteria bacterium]
MFPIRDTIQSKNYPIVNVAIIILNVFVYLVEIAQGQGLNAFLVTYGLVPARYSIPQIAAGFTFSQQIFAFISFMFLHGGFFHLLGNMWSLYIFGDNVEDRLGHFRYLLFYILCGLISGLSHMLFNWYSQYPTIGASGAIAGVMGAYLILYPQSKVLTLIPIFIIPYFIEIPAFIFLGIWFLLQFLNVIGAQGQATGVAWWAHIGGFIFGIIFLKILIQIPELGMTRYLRKKTTKQKSSRFHLLRSEGAKEDDHIYGSLRITPREAMFGTYKLINIPLGLKRRLFRVTIPPNVKDGTLLRLPGLGRRMDNGKKGDVLIRVIIQPS